MNQIQFILSYVCLLEVIYTHFGTLAAKISINQNITGILGNKDTNLTCSFVQGNDETFLSVDIIAKNLTEYYDDDKKPIAIFQPDKAAVLHPSGEYLGGRVTLTNITTTSTNVTLTFHLLKCEDEKDYMCKYNFIDNYGAVSTEKSEATRILVKGYAMYAVPIIIAVGLVVICLALRKHRSYRSKLKKNEGSRWQNLVDCLISWDCFTKISFYIPVVRKTNNAADDDIEDASNGLKENKISGGNKEGNTVKTSGISQDISITSNNIYAVPKDTIQRVIVEDHGIYVENGASHSSVDFAKVDQTKIKYYTSKNQTSETNDNMDHTEYAVPEDQLQD